MVGPSDNALSHSYIIQKKAIVNKLSFIFKDDKDMNARCATKKARGRRMLVPLALMIPLLFNPFYL